MVNGTLPPGDCLMDLRLYNVTPKGRGLICNIKVNITIVMIYIGLHCLQGSIVYQTCYLNWPGGWRRDQVAPGRPCWLRERAGLWLAGNDITHSQSEQLSQPHSLSPKL